MIGSVRVILAYIRFRSSEKIIRLDYWMLGRLTIRFRYSAMTNVMTNNEQRMSTYYIEDGSYLKLRNIELLYFSAKITNKMMMKNLRVCASQERITLKQNSGEMTNLRFDPEMSGYVMYLTPFNDFRT